jgi:hypothetical protein
MTATELLEPTMETVEDPGVDAPDEVPGEATPESPGEEPAPGEESPAEGGETEMDEPGVGA